MVKLGQSNVYTISVDRLQSVAGFGRTAIVRAASEILTVDVL